MDIRISEYQDVDIRISGYQDVDIRISEYQDVDIRISEYQVAGHQGNRDFDTRGSYLVKREAYLV